MCQVVYYSTLNCINPLPFLRKIAKFSTRKLSFKPKSQKNVPANNCHLKVCNIIKCALYMKVCLTELLSSSPRNHSMSTRPFPSLSVASGNETNDIHVSLEHSWIGAADRCGQSSIYHHCQVRGDTAQFLHIMVTHYDILMPRFWKKCCQFLLHTHDPPPPGQSLTPQASATALTALASFLHVSF